MNKIITTIFPREIWILLAITMLFVLLGEKFLKVSNLGFNTIIFLVSIKLAICIHEFGHLLFASMVGGTPRRMILGRGHKVAEKKIMGIKFILNSNLNSGLAYAAFNNLNFIRLKLLLYTSGGFITNFLFAGMLFIFYGFSINAVNGIQSAAIIIPNLLIGIFALIPQQLSYQGVSLFSDGLTLFKIPFYKHSQLVELSSVNEMLDAFELFESKKYAEAIALYKKIQLKTGGSKGVNINLSLAYIKLGKYERAIELMEELLPLIQELGLIRYKNIIYNGLAWEYLLINNLEQADKYSELAYEVAPNLDYIRGTRASVLIEKGKYQEGKNLLVNDIDFHFPNSKTLSAAMYAGLAFHELQEYEKSEKCLDFVEDNLEVLDFDENVLFKRVKDKIKDSEFKRSN